MGIEKIVTEPQQTTPKDDLEQDLRMFTFHDNDREKFNIFTKDIGSVDKIYSRLNSGSESEVVKAPEKLKAVIDAFADCRREVINNSGKVIKKAPHLLISGGFVRDILIGNVPNDIDLTTNLPLDDIYKLVKDLPDVKRASIKGESSKIVRVKFTNGEEYEISCFKKEGGVKDAGISPWQDAQARDLTANALFYNPSSGRIIDYVGGIKDIQNKTLRFTSSAEKRISEDAVRMVRYVRFLFKTGFTPTEEDKEAIRKLAPEIKKEASERIKIELDKSLEITSANKVLEMLDDLGLLEQIMPEIKDLQNCEQGPPYHLEGDVYKHTLLVTKNFLQSANLRLKWAGIFHDISKPDTREEIVKNDKNKVSFIGHSEAGAKKIMPILKRLSFSNKEIDDLKWLITNHQMLFQRVSGRIKQASEKNMGKAKNKSKAVLKKMIIDKGIDLVEDLVALSIADLQGRISEDSNNDADLKIINEIFTEVKKEMKESMDNGIDLRKLINGKIIMDTINIKPGPEIGRIQKKVLGLMLESEEVFHSKEEAQKRIKEYILKNK